MVAQKKALNRGCGRRITNFRQAEIKIFIIFQENHDNFDINLLLSTKKEQKNSPFVISKRDLYNQKIKTAAKFLFTKSKHLKKNHL
ncbi:hypothetical protein D9C08_23320 (plasmid) [Bacillus subtilis subsp. subtilis]|nr:hypothetical protein D9C12_23320 [Bacillus subtilis subsp. subtilis]AYL03280.1 hypothetical protein D9C08_23320 [Bacillus subtilis subsp. subtilis]